MWAVEHGEELLDVGRSGVGTLGTVLFVNHLGLYLTMLAAIPTGLVMVMFEERELVGRFGEAYRRYQRDVPRFVPRWRLRKRP